MMKIKLEDKLVGFGNNVENVINKVSDFAYKTTNYLFGLEMLNSMKETYKEAKGSFIKRAVESFRFNDFSFNDFTFSLILRYNALFLESFITYVAGYPTF